MLFGYWLHAALTGRGYATACARALTHAGLAGHPTLGSARAWLDNGGAATGCTRGTIHPLTSPAPAQDRHLAQLKKCQLIGGGAVHNPVGPGG